MRKVIPNLTTLILTLTYSTDRTNTPHRLLSLGLYIDSIQIIIEPASTMATPDPTPTLTPISANPNSISISIKSAARKLPIKRKPPPQSPPQTLPLAPNNSAPAAISSSIDDDNDDFDDDDDNVNDGPHQPTIGAPQQQPPVKFHRIWSEPDELRFLQGLLGCWSQGLVFPRDLNVFYDRFSESMPQPFTRSQLSEKLRRLRKKYRSTSSRIARGLDPNRLNPHDRDLLHLCTRLWDPKHTSTSPFSQPDSIATTAPAPASAPAPSPSGSSGNKRHKPNSPVEEGHVLMAMPEDNGAVGCVVDGVDSVGYAVVKAVLDVFDGSLEEMRVVLRDDGSGEGKKGLEKRWREQRVAELDVFARRLRLVLEGIPR